MKKNITFTKSLIPIAGLIITAAFSIFVWEAGVSFPLIVGIILASLIAVQSGWKWNEVQDMLVSGVSRVLPAIFILLTIGMIVGSWIASGAIPAMIYYGMMLINPAWFIPVVALVTGIVSITLGTSFTAIATVGLAFMGIGGALGFSPALVAGAVVSGAFFGDKLSPLSDTTNIAAAIVETDIFSHVKHMLWDTIPAFIISLVLFWIIGSMEVTKIVLDTNLIDSYMATLNDVFVIHPLLLLLPVFTIWLMVKRVPALPALISVALLGAFIAFVVQGDTIAETVRTMITGYEIETGVEAIDALLNRGGFNSMLETVGILIVATAFGGVLEGTGSFKVLTAKLLEKVKTTASLISTTLFTTTVVVLASGEQYLSIILPGRTLVGKYKEMNIDTKNLSRTVESMATVGINLIPWSVTAVFASGVLGVSAWDYIPYAFFIFLVPLINLLFGFTGWTIVRKDYNQGT